MLATAPRMCLEQPSSNSASPPCPLRRHRLNPCFAIPCCANPCFANPCFANPCFAIYQSRLHQRLPRLLCRRRSFLCRRRSWRSSLRCSLLLGLVLPSCRNGCFFSKAPFAIATRLCATPRLSCLATEGRPQTSSTRSPRFSAPLSSTPPACHWDAPTFSAESARRKRFPRKRFPRKSLSRACPWTPSARWPPNFRGLFKGRSLNYLLIIVSLFYVL